MKESRRDFIKISAGAAFPMMIPGVMPFYTDAYVASERTFDEEVVSKSIYSGFAEVDISPEIGMERPGNYMKVYHKSFHDPCKVRAAVFNDTKKRTAIVGIDALSIPRSLALSVRKKIEARCGIPGEAVLIAASHSHSSGPLGRVQPGEYDHADPFVRLLAYDHTTCADKNYLEHVENSIVEAVCEADKMHTESVMGVGAGHEDKAGANRRFHMKNGFTYTYPGRGNPDIIGPAGPIDPEVGVIGVWNKEGKCTGCIVNFARHANCPATGISANWIYYMEQTIKGAMGSDCIVIYLAGANGDISHDNNNDPYASLSPSDKTRYVGSLVGAEAVKVLLSIPRGVMAPIDYKSTILEIRRRQPSPDRVRKCLEMVKKTPEEVGRANWSFAKEIVLLDALIKKSPVCEVEVQSIQIGPAVYVSNPAELFCQYGLNIKAESPFKFTFPVELANGSVGYVPTEEAFGPNGGGYETRLTAYSNLEITAGTQMVDAGVALIRQMKPSPVPEFPEPRPFSGEPWSYGSIKPELE